LVDGVIRGVDEEDLASAGFGVHGLGVSLEGLTQTTDADRYTMVIDAHRTENANDDSS